MAGSDLDSLCNEVLTVIEANETHQLNWGFMDVRNRLDVELPGLLAKLPDSARSQWEQARAQGVTIADLLKNLEERRLLLRTGDVYRSRFAETARLLFLLRQRFTLDDWQTAPRLASDLKIELQRRRYPRRNIPATDLLADLRTLGASAPYLQAIERLLTGEHEQSLQLARFQVEAMVQLYRGLQHVSDRAMAVGAGTGAGKTKAFYVPALAEIAATLTASRWVRALAIYPRVELLKDQLAEAFSETRKLDQWLKTRNSRPIVLGAYYGDTPKSARDFLSDSPYSHPPESWRETPTKDGWICPFFFCPSCDGGDLTWSREDITREIAENERGVFGRFARLRCPKCDFEVNGDRLLLTREQLLHDLPDILFTTTEMLNRRLSRAREHILFGIDTPNPPRLLLLDEIHTYDGLNGAQVAYLLRRWRSARSRGNRRARHNLCIVGLSATLTQAETFLSKLTGIPDYYVSYVCPREDDLIDEGVEYNLVLKGDPVSGTSLLSTSVQTVMLLARMLDPDAPQDSMSSVSRGAIGHKIFAFTDKLDVINRWYHIEQDAEAGVNPSEKAIRPLSRLREVSMMDGGTRRKMQQMGQDWAACTHIGHNLGVPLRLGLTSSQYRGVRSNADLIIATSTLEVGFNDPTVGAVVQHKAPRSLASFLQRKGRAGRTRSMRPWMLVVTSAYGRDRWAFQHAETLFSPVLPPIELPLDNMYVRKIQACYTLMDWLSYTLKQQGTWADVWDLLISADKGRNREAQDKQDKREALARVLEDVLSGARLDEFSAYLQRALDISDEDYDRLLIPLLWGDPRSLLFEVIPTLLRQVESDWQRVYGNVDEPWSDSIASNPMPDFAPPNLFSDLNLPELTLRIPETRKRAIAASAPSSARKYTPRRARSNETPSDQGVSFTKGSGDTPRSMQGLQPTIRKEERLALLMGMTEFAPGHVNKRYARSTETTEAHWLELPDDAQLSRGKLPLQYLKIDKEPVPGEFSIDGATYQVFRPRAYTLGDVPRSVRNTSSARLTWKSHFAPQVRGITFQQDNESPSGVTTSGAQQAPRTPTAEQVSDLDPDPVTFSRRGILRLADGSPWSTIFPRIEVYTQANGAWIDATRLAVAVEAETRYVGGGEVRRRLEFEENGGPAALGFQSAVDAMRFHYAPLDTGRVLADPRWPSLYRHLGPEFFLYKLRHDRRLLEAGLSSFEIGWLWQLEYSMLVATAIARQCSLAEAAEEVDAKRAQFADRTMRAIFQSQQLDDSGEDTAGRLHQKVLELIAQPLVHDAVRDGERVLWDTHDLGLEEWLRETHRASLGSVLFTALGQLVPDIDPDELVLDVQEDAIWISEASGGGVGVVTKLADAIAQRPRDFDLQMLDTLQNCDREQLAIHLSAIAHLLDRDNEPLTSAFATARTSGDLPRQQDMRMVLMRTLEDFGIPAMREVIVALNAKYLRPNSGPDSDRLIATLVRRWEEEEARLGCSIDLRVMAVSARQIPEVDAQVQAVLSRVSGQNGNTADENQVFNLLQSMLWLTCHDSCPDCIEHWQPFQELAKPSRALLLSLIPVEAHPINLGEPGWEERVRDALAHDYRVQLACLQEELDACKQYVLSLVTTGVEIGFQFFYPLADRITRVGRHWVVDLTIPDLITR